MTAVRADLVDRADVEQLVVAFYETAFRDPLIGPIFTDVAHMDLAAHLPIMCDFWETVLFRSGAYRRNALQVHVALHARHPLTEAHFARWLELWTATVDDRFAGPVAERAKLQATRIAGSMERRLAGGSGSAFERVGVRDAVVSPELGSSDD
jgi:truncated hemoglobin YjbI